MENKFNNLIKIIKAEKMTKEEKTSIRFKVETFVQNNPINIPQKSPYFSRFHFAKAGKIFATGLLLMVIGVGGLSYSSASALPGDLLYPIKINLNEKIEEKLAFKPEKKIVIQQKRIETRFTEIETLIKEKKIAPENNSVVAEAEKQINQEKERLVNTLIKVQKINPEMASKAKNNIENSIKNHQEKIHALINERKANKKLEQNQENTELENSSIQIKVEKVEQEQPINLEKSLEQQNKINNLQPLLLKEELLIQNIKVISDTGNNLSVSSNEVNSSATNSQQNN